MKLFVTSCLLIAAGCGGPTGWFEPASREDAGVSDASTTAGPGEAGAVLDAGTIPDGGMAQATSRCSVDSTGVTCTREQLMVGGRAVTFKVPLGDAPAAGWPVVIYFQGSFMPGNATFAAVPSSSFGKYSLTLTVKALLDAGYAVLAPDALESGTTYWQTNIPPWSTDWTSSADHPFILSMLAGVADGTFGPLDASRLYATGLSSGGFMTSRMAVSYPGTFKALAIQAGSYATCSSLCKVPLLPTDHPPTLFVHGANDRVVPVAAMTPYRDALVEAGHAVRTVIDPVGTHEWLSIGITEIPAWFAAHP